MVSTRSERKGLLTQLVKSLGQRRNRAADRAAANSAEQLFPFFATYSNMSRDFRLPAILDKVRRAACALPSAS
eukprot:COSAG01_NODE_1700_length_9448_cov_53.589475_9_plen_73_part_00